MMNLKSDGKIKAKEVEPIKNIKVIQKIKQYLLGKQSKRDYMLFVVGMNVGLRAGDLLNLKIKDVFDGKAFINEIWINEEKTDKTRTFEINKSAKESIKMYLDELVNYDLDDYLFKSRKGGKITVESAHKIIKTTLRELGIRGNYGTHTLRKTFAYHTYINNVRDNPSILESLQKMLNHSSSAVTLRYIGITKEIISNLYQNLNL